MPIIWGATSTCTVHWGDLTFHGERTAGTSYGFRTLEGWEGLPDTREQWYDRAQSHGAFDAPVWSGVRRIILTGDCFSVDERDSILRELGAAMALPGQGQAHKPFTVSFAGRTLSANARLVRYKPVLDTFGVGHFSWAAEFVCPDPFRYGPELQANTPMPTATGGLEFDLFTDGETTTGFLEFGELPTDGRITVENPGTADAWERFVMIGPIVGGFTVRNVETGNVLRYTGDVPSGSELVMDSATGAVTLDGADRSVQLAVREWTPIPAGSSREFVVTARTATTPTPAELPPAIPDAVSEWWIAPTLTRLSDRTVAGGIGEDGSIVVGSWTEGSGEIQREVVGQAAVDDHNAPAVWASEGRRLVVAWTNHATDSDVHLKVSDASGSPTSLTTADDHVLTIPGASVSYTQIIHRPNLSTATTDEFWMLTRTELGGAGWSVVPFSVDQEEGGVTWGTPTLAFSSAPGEQMYVTTALGHDATDDLVRIGVAHNPAETIGALWGYVLDVTTGDVTNVMTGSVVGNLDDGTGLPISTEDETPVLAAPASGISRRLFYPQPGPAGFALAYAEWDVDAPDDAVYHLAHVDSPGNVTVTDHGVSGPRVGYTAEANYIGGMSFPDPCDGRLVTSHSGGGQDRIVEWTPDGAGYTTETLTERGSMFGRLIRPMGIIGAGGDTVEYAYTRMRRYSPLTYREYAGDLVFLAPAQQQGGGQVPTELGSMRIIFRETSW